MPAASQADVRKQIASGNIAPLYVILGADETAKSALAGEFVDLVEADLRVFNVDRFYGGETAPSSVIDALQTLPMMAPKRIVVLLHAERLLNPKSETASRDLEAFEPYFRKPLDTACLVIVAEDLDKRRSLVKLLLSNAVVVECRGPVDAFEAGRWVRDRVAQHGLTIDQRVARMVADRIGLDITRLRADVDRLALYAADKKEITEADVREVVRDAGSQDDWAVTRAIERGSAREALRELAAMMDAGAVPYMILGQLAWFVRAKMPAPKVSSAVEAVFRTDLAIKTSGGDPRALLERLVVELCR